MKSPCKNCPLITESKKACSQKCEPISDLQERLIDRISTTVFSGVEEYPFPVEYHTVA